MHAAIDRNRTWQQLATVVDRNQLRGVYARVPSHRNGNGFAAERSEVLGVLARNTQREVRTKRIMGVEDPILGQRLERSLD